MGTAYFDFISTSNRLDHLNFQRNRAALLLLLRRQKIQSLEPDHTPLPILHQHHIVISFLAHVFLLRIVEPDVQRVSLAIEVYTYSSHRWIDVFVRAMAGNHTRRRQYRGRRLVCATATIQTSPSLIR